MKQCNKCLQYLPISDFHKRKYKNGTVSVQPTCKKCKSLICAERYREKKDTILASNAKWREDNIEQMRSIRKAWWEAHPEAPRYYQSVYRASKRRACPPWLSEEQLQEIRDIYKNCPPGHHVDHIVPLNGKTVCGLHVPWNLQYLPALENCRKSNRLIV